MKAGAPEEILYVSKPHIGTFRLVTMVEHMRASIESLGGEIRFQSRVADVDIENGHELRQIRGVILADGERIAADHVILALGLGAEEAHGSLRVSLGRENTDEEIDGFVEVFPPIVEKLRQMSPLYVKG